VPVSRSALLFVPHHFRFSKLAAGSSSGLCSRVELSFVSKLASAIIGRASSPNNSFNPTAEVGLGVSDIQPRRRRVNSCVRQKMKHLRHPIFAALLLCLTGCASLSEKPDLMCNEVAEFANASVDYTAHSVELTTDFGTDLNKDKNVLFSWECVDGGYAPGHKLCGYLIEHTSRENYPANFRRVLACIGARAYVGSPDLIVEHLDAKIFSYAAKHVNKDVGVEVELLSGSSKVRPLLKITVQRSKDS